MQSILLSGAGTGGSQQSIAFGAIPAQAANSTVALTATASSGLPINFTSTTPTTCTVSVSTAALLAPGTCTIQANQAGNHIFSTAPAVTQNITVRPPMACHPSLGKPRSITSISPATWFAGKTYNITITGVFPANGPPSTAPGCTYSDVSVDSEVSDSGYGSGEAYVTATNGAYKNSTQTTATVAIAADAPASTAYVTVSCDGCDGAVWAPVQILATPQILCGPSMKCSGQTISGAKPPPQQELVGQKIELTTKPTTLPAGVTSKWTVAGTNFGWESSTDPPTLPRPTNLTLANLKTLWTEPSGGPIQITYEMCINVAGVDPANQCSLPATAVFNVTGLELKTAAYTNSLNLWADQSGSTVTSMGTASADGPTRMSEVVWPRPENLPAVTAFVSGDTLKASAEFKVTTPPISAMNGVRIEGQMFDNDDNLVGTLVASGVSISAGATFLPDQAGATTVPNMLNLTNDTAFPASITRNYDELRVVWYLSPDGQTCSKTLPSNCLQIGESSSQVYVTLAKPGQRIASLIPLTILKLAIGDGSATDPSTALTKTWNQFAGPANVTGWDGRMLYYYEDGLGFSSCQTSSAAILESTTGDGQCFGWSSMLMDALAMNGIQSQAWMVTANDGTTMVINDWNFPRIPSFPSQAPYEYLLTLPIEASGATGMVPASPNTMFENSIYGDLISLTTLDGQNTAPPSEKFFGKHFIVLAGSTYYDPSYGVTYDSECGFETHSIAGYAKPAGDAAPPTVPNTVNYLVREPSGCNIHFQVSPIQ